MYFVYFFKLEEFLLLIDLLGKANIAEGAAVDCVFSTCL